MRFNKNILVGLIGAAGMGVSGVSSAFAAGAVAATEIGTIVTDVVPVGTAVVTVSVFVYGYVVIKRLIR